MSTPAAIVLACSAAAFTAWFLALTRNGRRLAYVTAAAVHRLLVPATGQHGLDQPAGVRKMFRELAAAALSEGMRWKLWGLLIRSRRVCPANAHGAIIWRTRPWREILIDRECRDLGSTGVCWCGKLRDETPRAPAAASAPGEGTAPAPPPHGAVPLPPGGKLHPYRDGTPTRAERYSLRVPSYHSDPAEPIGAATGDFPRLIP